MNNRTEELELWKNQFGVRLVPEGMFTYGTVEWIYENNPENAATISNEDPARVWTLLWVEDKFLSPGFIQEGETNAMVSGWAVTSVPVKDSNQLVITETWITCENCNGDGYIETDDEEEECSECEGGGGDWDEHY